MGIHPTTEIVIDSNKRRIVDRKPSTDGFISTQNGGIEMEVDGAVLCHIFNLYSHRESDSENECLLPFGRLGWNNPGTQAVPHAHFHPGVETELVSEKRPFDGLGTPMDGNIMTSYFNALYHGVSDSQYQLASPLASLSERLNRLVTCFELLGCLKFKNRWATSYNLLMSSEWFEDAARVKRRVLTQGGTDHSFFEDIKHASGSSWEDMNLTDFFLLGKSTIEVRQGRGNAGLSEPYYISSENAIKSVLSSYEGCPAGSWKHNLFVMKEDVARALKIPNVLNVAADLPGVKVFTFTPRSTLWNRTVLLGAPTTA